MVIDDSEVREKAAELNRKSAAMVNGLNELKALKGQMASVVEKMKSLFPDDECFKEGADRIVCALVDFCDYISYSAGRTEWEAHDLLKSAEDVLPHIKTWDVIL